MISLTFALAGLSLLALLALVLAATALCQGRALTKAAGGRLKTVSATNDSELQALRTELDGLAAQIHAMQQLPAAGPVASHPREGLNVARRSQALRLHRHGNSPTEIASTLDIPRQEVELLLKVHRIVIHNI